VVLGIVIPSVRQVQSVLQPVSIGYPPPDTPSARSSRVTSVAGQDHPKQPAAGEMMYARTRALADAKALHPHQERDRLGSMTTAYPGDEFEGLGLRQRTLLIFLADGLVRSAVDVKGGGIGFSEGQARATLRSLEKRKLLKARGFNGARVRRSFGLTDEGKDMAAALMIGRWLDNDPELF